MSKDLSLLFYEAMNMTGAPGTPRSIPPLPAIFSSKRL